LRDFRGDPVMGSPDGFSKFARDRILLLTLWFTFIRTLVNNFYLEQPTELQRKTEETKQMKKHLEKLQREIQETRSSKSDKERQLNQERTRIQVRREKFLI
jgi:peptidoglycan hydrolase CwlO-like protein